MHWRVAASGEPPVTPGPGLVAEGESYLWSSRLLAHLEGGCGLRMAGDAPVPRQGQRGRLGPWEFHDWPLWGHSHPCPLDPPRGPG